MSTTKAHYSCAELAAMKLPGLPTSVRGMIDRAKSQGWDSRQVKGRGGKNGMRTEYAVASMPKSVQEQIAIRRAGTHPSPEHRVLREAFAAIGQMKVREQAAQATRAAKAQEVLKELAGGLSDHEAFSLMAHCEIAEGWKGWFIKAQPLKKYKSWEPFAHAYNLAEVPVARAVREALQEISPRSVQRWVGHFETGNFAALIDRRNGDKQRGNSLFAHHALLGQAALKLMMDRPGIKTGQLCALLGTAAIDRDSGEELFPAPSYDQVYRFQKNWIGQNRELYLQATNPDAWKNQCMLALGSYTEEITALNQRWEMDATPADWLLLDEDGKRRRYTVSVIIDVYSRRIMVVMARTPKTQTHCFALRRALLAWGVPGQVVTDNGRDYQSEHFRRVLAALDIAHLTRNPFSPEEKPLVERVIKTLNHSILELLPNFAGHSVADRKAIEARKSFADRLVKPGEAVEVDLTGEAMQALINKWISGIYEQTMHGALGMSPFARAASWAGGVKRIESERVLDILLAKPANGGTRTLQKKGLHIDGAWFIAAEFGEIDVGSTVSILETDDLGRVIVYFRKNFLCIAECPERTNIDRKAIAAIADAKQRARLSAGRKALKEATRGRMDTNALLNLHLNEKAASAGKLVAPLFGAKAHQSAGLNEAARAMKAQAEIQPSPEADKLVTEARAAMAEQKVIAHPSAALNVSIVAGKTPEQRYDHWLMLDAKNKRDGDLPDEEERRWHKSFPRSTTYSAQKSMREGGLMEPGK